MIYTLYMYFKHLIKVGMYRLIDRLTVKRFQEQRFASIFAELRKNLLVHSRSVLHIGASIGQEAREYSELGLRVVWVECIPEVFEQLEHHISSYGNQRAVMALLGSKHRNTTDFFLMGSRHMTSSIYRMKREFQSATNSRSLRAIRLEMRTLDELIDSEEIKDLDYLVLDVQGAELEVLKGAKNSLTNFSVIELECSTFPIYEGAPSLKELESFLLKQGFYPLQTCPERFHGNLVFIRRGSITGSA